MTQRLWQHMLTYSPNHNLIGSQKENKLEGEEELVSEGVMLYGSLGLLTNVECGRGGG